MRMKSNILHPGAYNLWLSVEGRPLSSFVHCTGISARICVGSKHPEQIFNVVCCDWQTKYYWKVLPENVQCIVYRFPEYIMPTPKTSPEAIPYLPKVNEEKEKRIAAKRAKELLGSE